jgi:hypothetical protein
MGGFEHRLPHLVNHEKAIGVIWRLWQRSSCRVGDEYRHVQYRRLSDAAFDAMEPELLRRCRTAASRNDSVPPGEILPYYSTDKNGLKITNWKGRESFVKFMSRPGRLARFWDDRSKSWYPPQTQRSA